MKLDEFDKKLLNEVQKTDACAPKIALIAKRLNKPRTTVFQRLQKLKNEKIITGYSAEVDAKKVGKPITTFMLATSLLNKNIDEIAKKLCALPGIQEVHYMTGEWDFLIKGRVSTLDEYYKLSAQEVLQTYGLLRSQGSIVPRTFKDTRKVDL